MIRHTPAGRGHAYRPSLDQRIPAVPLAGQPLQIRALVDTDAVEVRLELRTGQVTTVLDAHPLAAEGHGGQPPAGSDGEEGPGAGAGSDGHLAAAAAAGESIEGLRPVVVDIATLPAGQQVGYRWHADGVTSDWFTFTPATWVRAKGGVLRLTGPDAVTGRVVTGATEVLDAGEGPIRVRVVLRLDDAEHVLGLGERFHALDHRGRAIDTVVFEQYKQQGERTYLPVPFALVVGGQETWGLHVHTTRRCWFDVAATNPDQLIIEVATDPADPGVDLQLFGGDPAEVISGFLDATARPGPVPPWVFRPWASANEWNTQARVQAEMQRSLAEGIAVGVIVIEAWSDEATFTAFRDAAYTPSSDGQPLRLADFTFPPDGAWPDPAGMVDWLHDHGIKVLLWQIPLLPTDVPEDRHGAIQLGHDRQVLVDKGLAVREAGGTPYRNRGWWFPGALMPDFTSPEATRWWTDKRRYLLEDVGIDGFKTDGGEHAWGDELRYADGTRGDQTNNRVPNLYAQAYHQLMASTGTEGVTFSRAGFTGAGASPCHWAGDEDSTWEAFRASILAGLSAGISGVFAWGFDHGGFSGELPTPELYLRSGAMAMLCPIMQYHAEFNHHRQPHRDRTPWNIAERHDAPEVIDIYRRFTQIRERLVDYLHRQYHDGVARGLPLMRTLALHWPDDPHIWDHPHQYLLGDELLVAPVTRPHASSWRVYLPAGTWVDVWDGSRHAGGQVITVPVPLDRIPAFVGDTPGGAQVRSAFAAI